MVDARLETLYRKYHLLVKDTAYKVLHDYNLSQDVCQDVFVHLSTRRIDQEDSSNKMKNYLIASAYHRAIDYYRSKKRRNEADFEDNYMISTQTLSNQMDYILDYRQFLGVLFEELERFRVEWYILLRRVECHDEPIEIVARELGISVGSAKTKISQAKKWLRKKYTRQYEQLG